MSIGLAKLLGAAAFGERSDVSRTAGGLVTTDGPQPPATSATTTMPKASVGRSRTVNAPCDNRCTLAGRRPWCPASADGLADGVRRQAASTTPRATALLAKLVSLSR